MTQNTHCPIIHGGLNIDLKEHNPDALVRACCLHSEYSLLDINEDPWQDRKIIELREINNSNQWNSKCWACQGNELAGLGSYRTGMLEKFSIRKDLSGPQRLDLMFDISCNLACRICGPHSSTYWQRHIKEHNIEIGYTPPATESRADDMIAMLSRLDLSNLEMVVFCGGETLMGDGYWRVAEAIADLCPQAKDKITLSFQTNGTQPIKERYHEIISRFELVKFHISLDGVGERFEYLRWPASWNQVVDNIQNLKETLPVNVMFLIEETMNTLNLYYHNELVDWAKTNFSTNRLGDVINHSSHIADMTTTLNLTNLTQKYYDAIAHTDLRHLLNKDWQENSSNVRLMIAELDKFDQIRNQNWQTTFPKVAEFYSEYLR